MTYTWTIDGGTLLGSDTGSSVSFSVNHSGTVTLTCTAALGSERRRGTTQVTVQLNPPKTPQIVAPTSASVGATGLKASVSSPEANTSYAWTVYNGTITAGAASTETTFSTLAEGTLTLTCTATNTVGRASSQATVQVVPLAPNPPVITAPSQVYAQSANNTASVQTQANCTYFWTLSGGTIDSGQGTTAITFTAGAAATTMVLGCTVTNSVSVGSSSQQNIAVLAVPVSQTGYYGSCINADNLGNQVIGWNTSVDVCNRSASIRLRAAYDGKLKAIRPKFIWSSVRAGYALGNGGTIRIQIQTDDGSSSHRPSGNALASLVYDQPVTIGAYWPLLTFASPPTLTKGELYHIVFTNIAADPTANWVSLDHLFMFDAYDPIQPTVSNTDLGLLETDTTGAWIPFTRGTGHSYSPTIELDYEDGSSQGQGYIQGYGAAATTSWVNPKLISDTQGVRETFTVPVSDRVVSSVSVRVNRTSGTDPLIVRVEKSDGTLVGQGTVVVPMGTVSSSHYGLSWVKVDFATNLTLKAGQTYRLVLSSPAGTVHTTHGLEEGSAEGYKSTTYFADGYAEFNDGTGWKGWDLWGIQNRKDIDLQFFFVTH